MPTAAPAKPKETPIPGRHSPVLRRRLRKVVRELFADQYADAMELLDKAAGRKAAAIPEPDWRLMFTPDKLKRWSDDAYPIIQDGMEYGAVIGREDIHFELDKMGMSLKISPWDVEAPGARQAVKQAAMALSTTTNDFTAKQMAMIVTRIRSEIYQGIAVGDPYDLMAAKIKKLFGHADKERSMRIAVTETQRAIHQGLLHQYAESGVVEATQWLTSGAPCEVCIAIAAESEQGVALFAEYAKIGNNATYSSISTPPAHPRCMCSLIPVLIPVEQMPRAAA